jgi:L-malate glycosyltransferase
MTNNLKVLHLSSEKTWRGGEQQIAYLIEELSDLGVQNHVALKSGSAFEAHCRKNRIDFIALPFKNTADIFTAWSIRTYCNKNRFNVIHMHSAKSHGIGVLSAVVGNKTPLVLSRRVDFVPRPNFVTRWRYNHRAVKKILGVSDKITGIMKNYVSDPDRCVTVHSGIDAGKFPRNADRSILRKEFSIPDHAVLIGNTSALETHKDYPTFINTIEKLVAANIDLKAMIIGDGSLRQSLSDLVDEKDLQPHFIFTGFRNDIPEILPGLDIFLMTSETEGLGTSVLDAFATGVPVVSTDAGGIPEMVEHKKTGMLCGVKKPECLASAVIELLDNSALRHDIIARARSRVGDFTKENTAKKTLAIYQEIREVKAPSRKLP